MKKPSSADMAAAMAVFELKKATGTATFAELTGEREAALMAGILADEWRSGDNVLRAALTYEIRNYIAHNARIKMTSDIAHAMEVNPDVPLQLIFASYANRLSTEEDKMAATIERVRRILLSNLRRLQDNCFSHEDI